MNTKAFFRIVTFFLVLVLADRLIGAGLEQLYFAQKVGTAGQLNYTMLETSEDIVILGNSRAQHHYNNKKITECTGRSCYNGGVDGGFGIWLSYAAVDAILQRYTPKLLIVEFNPASVGYWKSNYEKLAVLLPYKDRFPVCDKLVEQRSKWEKMKWISAIYPYNSMAYTLITDKIFENRLMHVKGYMPIQNKNLVAGRDTGAVFNHYSDTSDVLNSGSLASLLQLCKNKRVTVLFINSPIFAGKSERLINQTKAAQTAIQMIKEAGFQYWDFTNDERMSTNARLFADQLHLNAAGADFYTSIIAEKLNNEWK